MASLIPAGVAIVGGFLDQGRKDKEAADLKASSAEARAQLQPFIQPGAEANQTIGNALSGGPGATDAFKQFQNSTGFNAQLEAGSQAISGNQATAGLLNSGSTLKRQTKFGSDLAQQGFTNFLGQLGRTADRGASAAGASSGLTERAGVRSATASSDGAGSFIEGLGGAFQTDAVQNFLGGL